MWRIPSAPPGFFPLGKSLHGSEVMGAYFVSNVQFCEVYYAMITLQSHARPQNQIATGVAGERRRHVHLSCPGRYPDTPHAPVRTRTAQRCYRAMR